MKRGFINHLHLHCTMSGSRGMTHTANQVTHRNFYDLQ